MGAIMTISISNLLIAAFQGRGSDFEARFRDAVEEVSVRSARQKTRRELLRLDDRELRDIGITREQALKEARRTFWD